MRRTKIFFKSFFILLISIVFLLTAACDKSKTEEEKEKYYGTWNVIKIEADGATLTATEIKEWADTFGLSYEVIDHIYITEKSGYMVAWISYMKGGSMDPCVCELMENGIRMGETICTYTDGLLVMGNDDITIYLEKEPDESNTASTN